MLIHNRSMISETLIKRQVECFYIVNFEIIKLWEIIFSFNVLKFYFLQEQKYQKQEVGLGQVLVSIIAPSGGANGLLLYILFFIIPI